MAEKMIDKEGSIENLQKYLREISYYDYDIPNVPIDGIYGAVTRGAVISFQKKYGFVPNGIVDKKTWDALYKKYKIYKKEYSAPSGIFPYPHERPGFKVEKDEKSDLVMLIQVMMKTLELGYDDLGDFEVNGVLDRASMNAIKQFQKHNYLPQTGLVDASTWNSLASNYNKYVKIN